MCDEMCMIMLARMSFLWAFIFNVTEYSSLPDTISDMSFEVEIDPLSAKILSWTAKLDDLGARDWNLYAIALVTTIVLFLVKLTLGKRLGIDWLAFVHALVTGIGGMFCVYLDFRAAEAMTGLPGTLMEDTYLLKSQKWTWDETHCLVRCHDREYPNC